jgi:hypothetical protein
MLNYLEGLVSVDPSKGDHRNFHDHVVAFNEVLTGHVMDGLVREFTQDKRFQDENFYLATTGSDSRYEKGLVSPVELVLHSEERPSDELVDKITEFVWSEEKNKAFDQYFDVKVLNDGPVSQVVFGGRLSPERIMVSPNRFLDSNVVYAATLDLYTQFWKKFSDEVKSQEGKSLIETIKSRVKQHRNGTLTGEQHYAGQSLRHFDLEKGVAFYDPLADLHSFKQGPLRLIQYALVRDKLLAIREGVPYETVRDLPANTVMQLNQALARDATELTPTEIADLADNYKYFMWQYQISQIRSINGENTSEFDSKEVKQRLDDVARICSNGIGVVKGGRPNRRLIRFKTSA